MFKSRPNEKKAFELKPRRKGMSRVAAGRFWGAKTALYHDPETMNWFTAVLPNE